MKRPLNQAHLLFLTDQPLDLPQIVTAHIGSVSSFVVKPRRFFRPFTTLRLNWRIRSLHARTPIDALIVDHPNHLSDSLRNFVKKFHLPLIANNLGNTFHHNIITRSQFDGFLQPAVVINGDKTSAPVQQGSAVIPLALSKSHFWKLAGYKSNILTLGVIAINPHPTEYAKLAKALDVVKSIDPDITIDVISQNDQDPTPLTTRLRKSHLIINVSTDPVWTETTAVAVAAGIPIISPKRPLHLYLPPKSFPGYIVADWQVDTLTTIIQNSLTHPEETYRVAKNAQHWLKTNLGSTFLPLTWLNGLQALLSLDPQTTQ